MASVTARMQVQEDALHAFGVLQRYDGGDAPRRSFSLAVQSTYILMMRACDGVADARSRRNLTLIASPAGESTAPQTPPRDESECPDGPRETLDEW